MNTQKKLFLLVIDVQNGFMKSESVIHVKDKIRDLLKLSARDSLFDYITCTQFENQDCSMFEKCLDWSDMKEGRELDVCKDIYGSSPQIHIESKNTYACLTESYLSKIKDANDGQYPEKIFLVGLDTDCCVFKTAVDLFEQGIRPVVLSSYCVSTGGDEFHKVGLICLRRLIGERQIVEGEVWGKEQLVRN